MAKKILFFCDLSSGHLNVALSLAKTIQRIYGNKFEIWFLVNHEYKIFVSKRLENCNFLIYSINPNCEDNKEEESKQHMIDFFGEFGDKWSEQDRVI